MPVPTPAAAIEFFKHIAALDWRPLTANDHCAFADAGPQARIADISDSRARDIAELFDIRPDFECGGLMAIIGGDALQLEIHGIDTEGDPIALIYDLVPNEQ